MPGEKTPQEQLQYFCASQRRVEQWVQETEQELLQLHAGSGVGAARGAAASGNAVASSSRVGLGKGNAVASGSGTRPPVPPVAVARAPPSLLAQGFLNDPGLATPISLAVPIDIALSRSQSRGGAVEVNAKGKGRAVDLPGSYPFSSHGASPTRPSAQTHTSLRGTLNLDPINDYEAPPLPVLIRPQQQLLQQDQDQRKRSHDLHELHDQHHRAKPDSKKLKGDPAEALLPRISPSKHSRDSRESRKSKSSSSSSKRRRSSHHSRHADSDSNILAYIPYTLIPLLFAFTSTSGWGWAMVSPAGIVVVAALAVLVGYFYLDSGNEGKSGSRREYTKVGVLSFVIMMVDGV